jgi:hypothetical protein
VASYRLGVRFLIGQRQQPSPLLSSFSYVSSLKQRRIAAFILTIELDGDSTCTIHERQLEFDMRMVGSLKFCFRRATGLPKETETILNIYSFMNISF